VRESESAAIANSGALDDGMKALLQNALAGGGNLPPEIRNEIMSLSRTMYSNKIPGAQGRVEMLKKTAEAAGLPADLVFSGDFALPAALPPAPIPTPLPTVAPPPGATVPQPGGLSPRAQQYLP
jgi:hypothetical protein